MSENNEPKTTSLVLSCCEKNMTSRNGFIWPGVGEIATAPDWRDDSECGGGLHGRLYGQGDHSSADYWLRTGAKWLVIEVVSADIRMLGGNCKFPSGKVVYVGGKEDAAAYILTNEPRAATVAVIGLSLQVGESQAVTVGALGTATAGDGGTICLRYYSKKNSRFRTVVGYVGEDGIEANTAYRLDASHKFVKVKS